MRYYPVALVLSLALGVTASAGYPAAAERLDPRAAALIAQARAETMSGRTGEAVDSLEAALVVQPGSIAVLLQLADVTRLQGMQGKAIRYYRVALASDPRNLQAISGEGLAMVEKGAVEKARRNLARLEGLCGGDCEATRQLASAIEHGPAPRVVSVDAVKPRPVASED